MRGQGHFPGPIASLLLLMAAMMITSIGILLQIDPRETGAVAGIGPVAIALTIGFGGVASAAVRFVPPPHPERLGLRVFEAHHLPWLLALVPFVIVASELDNVLASLLPAAADASASFAEESALAIAQEAIARVGLMPVVTEWFFRGVILQGAVAHLGRGGGLFFTAVLSALLMPPMASSAPLVAVGISLLFGLLLGAVRLATGSLLASILLHASWQAIIVAAASLAGRFPIDGLNVPGTHTAPLLLGASLGSVAWGLWMLWHTEPPTPLVLPIPEPTARGDDEGGFF